LAVRAVTLGFTMSSTHTVITSSITLIYLAARIGAAAKG
jgi:hypothetical protein